MVWDSQKPKIGPREPPNGPNLGHFVGNSGHFGRKKTRFSRKNLLLQMTFKGPPEGLGHSKTQNQTQRAPEWAQMGQFGEQNGHFGTKNIIFSKKIIFAQNDARKAPKGSGTLKNPKKGRGSPQTDPTWAVL